VATMPDPDALRACYLSGQMSEAQWQEHSRLGHVPPPARGPCTDLIPFPRRIPARQTAGNLITQTFNRPHS
jgi:hypothetical protein